MPDPSKELTFRGRLVMVGFGCIGQGVLPLLLRHIDMLPHQVQVITADTAGTATARTHGVTLLECALTHDNFRQVLTPMLAPGDFLLNLSVEVSSAELITLCRERGALYLDTCIEPWAGGYVSADLPPAQRSNYALREAALALRTANRDAPTAVLTHGANPGLVSHLVKQALLDLAQDLAVAHEPAGPPQGRIPEGVARRFAGDRPACREDWARLAQRLGIRVIHVAERDTQVSATRRVAGEFVNTWSVDAFVAEGLQPAELGWGSHERHFPADGARHASGSRAAIYLNRPGAATRVRSWTPLAGPQHAFLITHGESISIADFLTLGDPDEPSYRPTVHYAYHPCDDAVLSVHELAAREWRLQSRKRVLKDDIVSGIDELGVLLMGHARGAYWYGSQLSTAHARALAPHNSATSLQVTAAAMAGVVWAMQNPARDVIEPDEMPFERILALTRPYLGDLVGAYTDWTPLEGRARLFDEDLDRGDPWQFKNFRVS
jgi:homospermidine synthase